MEVFRISKKKYSRKIHASGQANRWNKFGQNVVYCGSSRSLSVLEMVVHRASIFPKKEYEIMVIEIDANSISELNIQELPNNWRQLDAYSKLQEIGSGWYENCRSLILKVPSVLIPEESNYIINTEHPDFKEKLFLKKNEKFVWDGRLL